MSLAGKNTLAQSIRSLFRKKEQAPSASAPSCPSSTPRALPLSPEQIHRMDIAVKRWVKNKEYRLPDHSIEETAARMGTTSAILYRYCIHVIGQDFRSWRVSLRMEDAKTLLLQDRNASASEIAREVGITDRSNFLRQFQSYAGCTPDEWRKRH